METGAANINILHSQDNKKALLEFIQIIQTSYGPMGRLKIFQNECGSFLSKTSSSSRILTSFQITNPVLQVVVAALKGHIQIYKDGGLFTALLTTRIILNHQDDDIPVHLTLKINDYILEKILSNLESKQSSFTYEIDIGKLNDICKLLTAILRTKSACQMSDQDVIKRVAVNILKAVIKSLPQSFENCLHIISCEGPPEIDCRMVEGLLVRLIDLDTPMWSLLEAMTGECMVAVFTTSLAGDYEVFPDKSTIYTSSAAATMEDVILNDLYRIADGLLKFGVTLVLCQKVVHPLITRYLREKGTLVIDRLGLMMMSPIENLIGCIPICSPSTDLHERHFGVVKKIEPFYFHDKCYLWLHKSDEDQATNTLVICGPDENTLEELKCVCESAQSVAHQAIKDPRTVAGAGCFEIQVASLIRQMVCNVSEEELLHLNCTKGQFNRGADAVARSFEYIARMCYQNSSELLIDTSFNHLWAIPPRSEWNSSMDNNCTCCCGHSTFNRGMNFRSILEKSSQLHYQPQDQPHDVASQDLPEILDLLVVKRASINLAFELANTVLRIKHTILDNGS